MFRFVSSFRSSPTSLYIRSCQVISSRYLSTEQPAKSAAMPVGTGLSTVQAPDNLPMIYVPTLFSRIKTKLGLQGELREPQKILYQASAISYYMIASSVDFDALQRELNMPDVYASFGRLIFLHVWFLLVRYVQLGREDERFFASIRTVLSFRADRRFPSSSVGTNDVGRFRSSCSTNSSRSIEESSKSVGTTARRDERVHVGSRRRSGR